jgi:hypothetical protein
MSSTIYNAKGTSNTSFKIHKSGPTLYQGPDPLLVDLPKDGDLYIKIGDDSFMFQFQGGKWKETGKVTIGNKSLRAENNVNISSNEYVYYGKSENEVPLKLSMDGNGQEISIPLMSSGQYQVSVMGSSLDHLHHVAMTIKGLYVNFVDGQGMTLGDSAQEIMYQTDDTLSADIVVTNSDQGSSLSVIVSGLAGTEIMWSAFIHSTTVNGVS